ncbi:MAG: PAS domain-containing protein [Bacteroidia bacterium]|nr:PAS domain-containing protein [Bacteroidia bacterium]MDW8159517.1 PAS domain-containing protein [Bacteroidia bacterium]
MEYYQQDGVPIIEIGVKGTKNFDYLTEWASRYAKGVVFSYELISEEASFNPLHIHTYNIILLDAQLPPTYVIAFLKKLEFGASQTPVFMLCTAQTEAQAIQYLELGITDYFFEDRLDKLSWYIQKIRKNLTSKSSKVVSASNSYAFNNLNNSDNNTNNVSGLSINKIQFLAHPTTSSDFPKKLIDGEYKLEAQSYYYLFREIFNISPRALCLLAIDGIILEVNKTALKIGNIEPVQAIGKHFWEAVWFEGNMIVAQSVREAITEVRKSGKKFRGVFELVAIGKNRVYTIDLSITPLKNDAQEISFLLVEGTNITKLRTLEKQLEKIRIRLECYIQASNDGYFEIEFPAQTCYFSSRFRELFEYEEGELENSLAALEKIIYEEDLTLWRQNLGQLQKREVERFAMVVRFWHKKKKLAYVFCKAVAIYDKQSSCRKIVGVVTDVTSLLEVQNALKQSQEKIATILSAIPDTVLQFDKEGTFKEYTATHPIFLKELKREHIGKRLESIFPPVYWIALRKNMQCARKHGVLTTMEVTFLYNDTLVIFENRIIYNDNIGYLFILRDITERKNAEKALLQSQERLKLATDAAELGIWDWDLITNKIHLNEQWLFKLGYTDQQNIITALELWEQLVYEKDRAKVKLSIENHLSARKENHKLSYRMLTQKGEVVWVYVNGKIIEKDTEGRPMRMIGIIRNIHFQKLAEIELRRSKLRLALALKASEITFCEWDLGTGKIFYEKGGFEEFLGIDTSALGNTYQSLIDLFREEDQKKLIVALENYLRNKTHFESLELQIQKKDTGFLSVSISALITEYSENGDAAKLMITLRNIQKQKELESQVQAYEQKLLASVILEQDREGARIAELLHESVAQHLYAAWLNIEKMHSRLQACSVLDQEDSLNYQELRNNLQTAIQQVRNITYGLRPLALEDFEIKVSLEKLISEISSQYGIEIDFSWAIPSQVRFRSFVQVSLYRIVQDVLQDFVNYLPSTFLFLFVGIRAQKLLVSFETDFSEGRSKFLGCYKQGQSHVEARVKLLKGNIHVHSNSHLGNILSLELPLHPSMFEEPSGLPFSLYSKVD